MSKLQVKIVSVGYLPADFHREKIEKMTSRLFEVVGAIESYSLNSDTDLEDWGYSDALLSSEVPKKNGEDILIVLTSVPLEDNYYTRRVSNNTIIFTFHEVADYLRYENIPLENVVKRLIYGYSLVYLRNGNRIPKTEEFTNFTHDETRGCLYDMNGLKEDIVHSCHSPQICDDCTQRLLKEKVSSNTIKNAKAEIKSIQKQKYYQILGWIKNYPVWSILLSSAWAVFLGVIASLITNKLS
ncbi:hypothetical protein [Endozoicomonas numazuensis]|uniref:Uncharacterized protein n=1 Tax=Endozoicomonas numazuensis TaxID=1137799 RepID=A0A081NDY9_9GAMM|nr:hypothetical protein [Endozoicomonas numazuensis]KEQ16662.1 hypothetical protein GZ78_18255 [Endozoicomonas numazuensis]